MEITGIIRRKSNGFLVFDCPGTLTGEYGVNEDEPELHQSVLDYIKKYPDRVIPHPDESPAVTARKEVLARLAELDTIIDRQTEQLYTDMGKVPSYKPMADAIAEKKALRAKL